MNEYLVAAAATHLGHDLFSVRGGIIYLDEGEARVSSKDQYAIEDLAEEMALPMQTYEEAEAAVLGWIEEVMVAVKGPTISAEEGVLAAKATAASAYLEGTATDQQKNVIEDEASITGEDPKDLAELIMRKATAYGPILSKTTGLKRKLLADLKECRTPKERIYTMAKTKVIAIRMLQDFGISIS